MRQRAWHVCLFGLWIMVQSAEHLLLRKSLPDNRGGHGFARLAAAANCLDVMEGVLCKEGGTVI